MERTRPRSPAPRCPLCREDVLEGAGLEVRGCPGCQTRYHALCLAELGGCATLGCAERGAPVEAVAAPDPKALVDALPEARLEEIRRQVAAHNLRQRMLRTAPERLRIQPLVAGRSRIHVAPESRSAFTFLALALFVGGVAFAPTAVEFLREQFSRGQVQGGLALMLLAVPLLGLVLAVTVLLAHGFSDQVFELQAPGPGEPGFLRMGRRGSIPFPFKRSRIPLDQLQDLRWHHRQWTTTHEGVRTTHHEYIVYAEWLNRHGLVKTTELYKAADPELPKFLTAYLRNALGLPPQRDERA